MVCCSKSKLPWRSSADGGAIGRPPEQRCNGPGVLELLRGVAAAAVHHPRQQVQPGPGHQRLVEREAPAPLRIDGIELGRIDANRRSGRQSGHAPDTGEEVAGGGADRSELRESFGLHPCFVRLPGRAQPVAGRCREGELGQDLRAAPALRIRRRARVVLGLHGATGLERVAPVDAAEEHALHAVVAGGQREVAAQIVRPAVPRRLPADVKAVAPEEVGRVLGDQRHDPAERVAAVERRVGAADDLDRFQHVRIHAGLRYAEQPEVELLRRLHAVDLRQDAVAADTADVDPVQSEAGDLVLRVDARLVLHEVRQVLEQPVLDDGAVDDRGGARDVPHRRRPQRGGYGYGIEKGQSLGVRIRVAGGLPG